MEFKQSEGTIYGAQYHSIRPDFPGHAPTWFKPEWNTMIEWCVDTFGPSGTEDKPGVWTPGARWYVNDARFWFREEYDRAWFLLRWT